MTVFLSLLFNNMVFKEHQSSMKMHKYDLNICTFGNFAIIIKTAKTTLLAIAKNNTAQSMHYKLIKNSQKYSSIIENSFLLKNFQTSHISQVNQVKKFV